MTRGKELTKPNDGDVSSLSRTWIDPFSSLHVKSRRDTVEFLLDNARELLDGCVDGTCNVARMRGVFVALLTAGEIFQSPRLTIHATVLVDAVKCPETEQLGEDTIDLIRRTCDAIRKELI